MLQQHSRRGSILWGQQDPAQHLLQMLRALAVLPHMHQRLQAGDLQAVGLVSRASTKDARPRGMLKGTLLAAYSRHAGLGHGVAQIRAGTACLQFWAGLKQVQGSTAESGVLLGQPLLVGCLWTEVS